MIPERTTFPDLRKVFEANFVRSDFAIFPQVPGEAEHPRVVRKTASNVIKLFGGIIYTVV
jgi:hypothetical protein